MVSSSGAGQDEDVPKSYISNGGEVRSRETILSTCAFEQRSRQKSGDSYISIERHNIPVA